MVYIIILTPLVILFVATAYLSRKILNYVMSNHPTLISGIGKVKICGQETELEEINDDKLTAICNKRQLFMRLFIGYAGIAFMFTVFYWVYLILGM